MALRRLGVQQVLPVENRENAYHGIQGKAASQRNANQPRRAALGDIANKENLVSGKHGEPIAKRGLKKSQATSSLLPESSRLSVVEETKHEVNLRDVKEEIKEIEDVLTNVEDIDEEDMFNPQLCAEYVNEIYAYMRELERKFHINGDPMSVQSQVEVKQRCTPKMRSILIDWLIQVHLRFRLLQETLFMTVDIIDRFLNVYPITREKLQLVGVSAMLLASKYEEMYAPEIGDFVYITDSAYTKAQIREMESLILRTLEYNIGKPLCLHFLRRNSKAGNVNAMHHTLAKYLLELSIVDPDCVKFLPSEKAAAALLISIKVKDNMEWTPTLRYYSTYSEEQLKPAVRALASLAVTASAPDAKQKAVKTKYSSQKFMRVATLPWVGGSDMVKLSIS